MAIDVNSRLSNFVVIKLIVKAQLRRSDIVVKTLIEGLTTPKERHVRSLLTRYIFFYSIFLPDFRFEKECESVVSPGIEPGSRASETLILSVVLRDQCANIVTACVYNVYDAA
jgi:hypothetical protein